MPTNKRNLFRGVCPHCEGLIEIEIDENGDATLTQIWRKENADKKENKSATDKRNDSAGRRFGGTDERTDENNEPNEQYDFWENF